MRRRESKAFTNFNSLLFKSTASWPLLYLRPLIHTFFFAAVFSYLLVILEVLFYEPRSLVQDR